MSALTVMSAEPSAAGRQPVVELTAGGLPLRRHRMGEWLVEKGRINRQVLEAASHEQEVSGDRLGQILVAGGYISDRERVEAILAVSSERIAQENVTSTPIPVEILDEMSIIVSSVTDEAVYVSSMEDEDHVRPIVQEYYPNRRVEFVAFLPSNLEPFVQRMRKTGAISGAANRSAVLDRLIFNGLTSGASDIHILPRRKSYTVFFRLLGVRQIVYEGPLDEYVIVNQQVKDLSRMDLAERKKPQDGGYQVEFAGKMVDLRVSTSPNASGLETCVIRLLDPDRVRPSLAKLGISGIEDWRRGFNQQHGLCIICGPTGSGKTTTLNASIREINRFEKAVYSIEDPVEYQIAYTSQMSVNNSVGLTFANGIRAMMRSDPDVIVLGEVRDEETARNMVKAADTGHLVLATLHTGSIQGTVSRLKDLGIHPRELRDLLRSVLVQTLVRTTCKHCAGEGCAECSGTGYSGRSIVSECCYFRNDDEVQRLIDGERWWKTKEEDAVDKMLRGETDRRELRRVFGAAVDEIEGMRE